MRRDPLIGLVGKPSSGKSTTLNSLTDASSKATSRTPPSFPHPSPSPTVVAHALPSTGGNSFTTLTPNRAIGYLRTPCACARFSLQSRCRPNHGSCLDGQRSVPIELLDVAGLVPGAHEGKGLGNRFLDDLRHADALVHVVDVSGTTDQDGKATRGYDPSQDIVWLQSEIIRWIEGNLVEKWGPIKRRHVATKSSPQETLQAQFSGYGATSAHISATLASLSLKTPLENWDAATIHALVAAFVATKFPTVLALNKIDHPDADANVARIAKAHPPESLVLTSAISEVFLRRLAKQGYVRYVEGGDLVETRGDLVADGDPDGGGLKEMDDKLRARIENLRDMVLYRFGSTGVVQVLGRAAELLGLVPVFPVRNVHALPTPMGGGAAGAGDGPGGGAGGSEGGPVFRDCVLVKRGTTVREVARKVIGDAPLAYVEGVGGVRVAEDEVITVGKCDILSFKIGR